MKEELYAWKASGRRFKTQTNAESYLSWVKGCMPGRLPDSMGITEATYKKKKKKGLI